MQDIVENEWIAELDGCNYASAPASCCITFFSPFLIA
jgi:hypothetical protein